MEPIGPILTTLAASKTKDAAVEAGKEAGKGLIQRLLGPGFDAWGEVLALPAKERLYSNLIDAAERAVEKIKASGLPENTVPLKVLHPLLEGASLEEKPEMRERWANLIANTVIGDDAEQVAHLYPTILKELSSREARFLDALCREDGKMWQLEHLRAEFGRAGLTLRGEYETPITVQELSEKQATLINDEASFDMAVRVLLRNRLLEEESYGSFKANEVEDYVESLRPQPVYMTKMFLVSPLGVQFFRACQPPPKA